MLNFIKENKFKLIVILIAIIASGVTGTYLATSDNVTEVKQSSFNFDSTIVADYEYVAKAYDTTKVKMRYFESQGKLANTLYESTDGKCTWIKSVFAVNDTVIFITHDTAFAKPVIEKIHDIWLEDQVTTPYNKVTLNAAIDSINKVDIIRPKSKVFVLRRPLYPPFPDHNFYIFGDFGHSPFIQVDSKTGEVKTNQF